MQNSSQLKLRPSVTPLNAWAFAIGTAVGWGSLVVTASSYLGQAGPWGSVLGLVIGTIIMLIIGRNYAYLMQIYPDAGGAYSYCREVFGPDYAFLAGWFLALTYLAVLWANATSIPLFARYFMGGVFRVGRMYTFFGYDVYFGETIVTILAILLIALLCMRSHRAAVKLMTGLGIVFSAGIALTFVVALLRRDMVSSPAFLPDASAIGQILKIAVITPWAFIGFESISHSSEEFTFERKKIFKIMVIAVVSTGLLYIFVTLLSVTAYPERYASWIEYIRDRGNLSGIEALPAFYAAYHYMGQAGVGILMAALLSLVITSLIGNTTALSRLFYTEAKDGIMPTQVGSLNEKGIPHNAIKLIAAVSIIAPFVGRTAIGWIVDVTTIGATLIYGFVSAAAMKVGKERSNPHERTTGLIGLVIMIAFGLYTLLPNLVSTGSMERETYFIFVVWSVLGFLFFRWILSHDRERRYGGSIIVWVALLAMVLLISLIWMKQSMINSNDQMLSNVKAYYQQIDDADRYKDEAFIEDQMDWLDVENTRIMLMAIAMFGIALAMMFTNHSYLNSRAKEAEHAANVDPMTGVKSKHAYLTREREINTALKEGRLNEFAIAVCDVNGLKKINDTLGHKAGDDYIISASRMICDIFQHSPVYRTGGDEFVAILTGRDYESRRNLMKTLHDRSVENISKKGVVVSGGLSDYNSEEDHDFHTVFERADALMYEEKQLLKGLGSITRDEDPDEEVEEPQAVSILNVRKHVLIVEDEAINRAMLEEALHEDYDVLTAADGLEALQTAREHSEDLALMLLDLQMPNMDGFEVLRQLKQDRKLKGLPVIVLTADQAAEVECLKLGAMDFIPKPYPAWEVVRARVNRCIESHENHDLIQSTERDSLTKLYNIDYFLRFVGMYDRHYPDMAMDAVVIDVNHFHMINERYGKTYADEVLKRLGERIRSVARKVGGVGCRQGADTFLLYAPYREDYEGLLRTLSEGVTGDAGTQDRVRLRLGAYQQVDKSLDIERRYDRAKMAADTTKQGNSSNIGIYNSEMHERALYKERLLEDFPTSIRDKRFRVFYQPKFDIRPDKPILSSAEALVRWDHPELGMISPAVFIPLLEESGRILDLDMYVWRETARQIRAWKDRYGYSVPVSVNVSRIDMLTPNLKSIFNEILNENRLETGDIILEITESAYAEGSDQVLSTARDLQGMGMGFRIEMDDFGTGYSSLGMLTKLPIDALKLDMSFIRNAFGENRDVRMIELIIDIADYLRVPVVAEGVETEEQLMVLKALGCDLVQGYFFSKPVPAEDFERFLVARGAKGVDSDAALKKNYMSISKALTSDFESIYYVDISSSFYLEFYAGPDGSLQIRPGGTDFFEDARSRLLSGIVPEDAERVGKVLSRESLSSGENISLSYRQSEQGVERRHHLQTLRTRASDLTHVVIGLRPEH